MDNPPPRRFTKTKQKEFSFEFTHFTEFSCFDIFSGCVCGYMSLVTARLHTVNSCYKEHTGLGEGGGGTVKGPFALSTLWFDLI